MPSAPVPCRLFIILAREAPIALIFRRGPTKWTQLIRWHTDTDTFEPGAWSEGIIHPERSDLSPDETKLIYQAADYSMRQRTTNFPQQWTAISKVPWLTALIAWDNCNGYFGGGLFETNSDVWVNESSQEFGLSTLILQNKKIIFYHPISRPIMSMCFMILAGICCFAWNEMDEKSLRSIHFVSTLRFVHRQILMRPNSRRENGNYCPICVLYIRRINPAVTCIWS